MRVARPELALEETAGMQMAAVGCLLMVAQCIADECPDRADVLRKVSRADRAETR